MLLDGQKKNITNVVTGTSELADEPTLPEPIATNVDNVISYYIIG